MGQVEKERKHAQIQQEDTRAMKRPVTKRRLCLRKQSSGFIPGASSLHVEASMGKTLNPKLLPAAVCVQSQWRRVWTNGLPQRPTVTSLNTNYSGGENNTEPTQIGGSVLLPYMLQPSLHQEQNHGDATWRSPRTRTCTLCRYKRLNTSCSCSAVRREEVAPDAGLGIVVETSTAVYFTATLSQQHLCCWHHTLIKKAVWRSCISIFQINLPCASPCCPHCHILRGIPSTDLLLTPRYTNLTLSAFNNVQLVLLDSFPWNIPRICFGCHNIRLSLQTLFILL
uniref:uncharacterized protein LOC117270754 isoform X1 n=1 Tax=Epinephelus lanceolatus TaxID=310571 RepID=UPI0014469216|nr:uncharacterized protein LOC117270754 isoform X1 [Epinephelus lanceolatus]